MYNMCIDSLVMLQFAKGTHHCVDVKTIECVSLFNQESCLRQHRNICMCVLTKWQPCHVLIFKRCTSSDWKLLIIFHSTNYCFSIRRNTFWQGARTCLKQIKVGTGTKQFCEHCSPKIKRRMLWYISLRYM